MKKKLCIFLCLCTIFLLFLQRLLMPKYMETNREGALIGEYYANAGGNDVIFIGDCEVYENFSPITLWEKYGITSYIRGSAQQTIWQSYYLMEETFRYETPQVMVFNVLAMKYDTPESTGSQSQREAYNRMTLDTMRWSSSKWNAIAESMTREEQEWESMFSYLFPLLRYHDRWSELTGEDFRYFLKKEQVSDNGYLMQTGIAPVADAHAQPPLADYSFGDNSWHYLEKMAALCQAHGTQLVLIKAPSLYPVWWPEWEEQIENFATDHNLIYINMLEYQDEIGIDWSTDTYDTGLHLNVYGAEKAASWLGSILAQQCGVPDRRSDETIRACWAEKVKIYDLRKEKLESSRSERNGINENTHLFCDVSAYHLSYRLRLRRACRKRKTLRIYIQ